MYEQPYFEQSRMSKAWLAANFGGKTPNNNSSSNNMMSSYNNNNNNHNQHAPLQAGLSNASNVSRHSQMTNYLTPLTATARSNFMMANDNHRRTALPPLVTSTPYTRQVSNQAQNGTASLSYHPPRNIPGITSSARYYQREDARALWQPAPQPQNLSSRQPVVAFKKTPIFYEDQKNEHQNSKKIPANVYYDNSSPTYLNTLPGGVKGSVPPVKRSLLPPQNFQKASASRGGGHHLHSSSGGDSCCSSCCSLSSGNNQQVNNAGTSVVKNHHKQESSCDSTTFSSSSTCSCCSCHRNNDRRPPPVTVIKPAVPIMKQAPAPPPPAQPNTGQASTLTMKHLRNRAERRRTISGRISPSDLGIVNQVQHQTRNLSTSSKNVNNETTPTPGSPPSVVYSNDIITISGGRRSRTPVPAVPPKPVNLLIANASGGHQITSSNSRDSGIGVMTPASQTHAQEFNNNNNNIGGPTPVPAVSSSNYAHPNINSKKSTLSNLVKTSSGSIKSSQSGGGGNNVGVIKTIIVAPGESSPDARHTPGTVYATTVQTPTSMRSSRTSSGFMQQEMKNKFVRNSSFSSSTTTTTSSSSQMRHNNQTQQPNNNGNSKIMSAGGQVSVASSATRCVPVPPGNERFIWVDDGGSYDDGESGDKKLVNYKNNGSVQPSHQQQGQLEQNPTKIEKPATIHRKHSSFFRTILSTLFGIRPKQHSDGDADDPKVNVAKQRRLPSRSASAVATTRTAKQAAKNKQQQADKITQSSAADGISTNKSFYSQLDVDDEKTTQHHRNRTWHGLKGYTKRNSKADMRSVFDSNKGKQMTSSNGNLSAKNGAQPVNNSNKNIEDETKSTYTTLSKDDGSSTLGRQSNTGGAVSVLSRPVSRGTSLASTLKGTVASSGRSAGGPLFLVKRRAGSSNNLVALVPGTPGVPNPNNPSGETAIIANVEQLLMLARVHPTLEYEWIPDDYLI